LLEVLREQLGVRSPKDGCSPQGQCGCCTVLVDGAPRVACVTPVRRVAGRAITTLDGLDPALRDAWADAFTACGASQCGFCTPGIIMRLEGHRAAGDDLADRATVDRALAAHLCRCTGWQTIREAAASMCGTLGQANGARDLAAAGERATLESHRRQQVGPHVALGDAGFADDVAPDGALVAVAAPDGTWVVEPTLRAARQRAGKVQGRRTSVAPRAPLDLPEGDWVATLQTTWVEPAYLETDATWAAPDGAVGDPLANAGAFGGKEGTEVIEVARRLATEHRQPVRVLYAREDAVRRGPKRPPVAGGVRADGTGVLRIARTDGVAGRVAAAAPGLVVEEVDVVGPPTSTALRAAGWAEALVLLAAVCVPGGGPVGPRGARAGASDAAISVEVLDDGAVAVRAPTGAWASVAIDGDGTVRVVVDGGQPLDEIVLRSYAIGAVFQALSWVTSEAIAVDDVGAVLDLTIRSFGILRPAAMPNVEVTVLASEAPPVAAADAVFTAAAAACWRRLGCPPAWPA
jgi:aerobic-type carbon monoxide dehydrogenase small subunit (CoxS/CutS family)